MLAPMATCLPANTRQSRVKSSARFCTPFSPAESLTTLFDQGSPRACNDPANRFRYLDANGLHKANAGDDVPTMKADAPIVHIHSGCPCTRRRRIPHKPSKRYQLRCTAPSGDAQVTSLFEDNSAQEDVFGYPAHLVKDTDRAVRVASQVEAAYSVPAEGNVFACG